MMDKPVYQEYACGFMFNAIAQEMQGGAVALIHKIKPEWMKDQWNAIGGKIEVGETPLECMQREFYEETGVAYNKWEPFARIEGDGFTCYFFRAFSDLVHACRTMEAEKVEVWPTFHLPFNILRNLHWLVPMALHEVEGCGMPYRIREAGASHRG